MKVNDMRVADYSSLTVSRGRDTNTPTDNAVLPAQFALKPMAVPALDDSAMDRATIGRSKDAPSTYEALGDIVKGQKSEDKKVQEQEEADQEKIQELKERDREVRVHEQAHAAVGGQYAGAPTYEFETGPDGNRYAVGGEVSIDVSEEKAPEDTIAKMQIVKAAAMAPAEPSAQDYKVAAEASQKEQSARAQLAKATAELADTKENSVNSTNEGSAKQALQHYQTIANPVSNAFTAQA
jgi:hypothetical protein